MVYRLSRRLGRTIAEVVSPTGCLLRVPISNPDKGEFVAGQIVMPSFNKCCKPSGVTLPVSSSSSGGFRDGLTPRRVSNESAQLTTSNLQFGSFFWRALDEKDYDIEGMYFRGDRFYFPVTPEVELSYKGNHYPGLMSTHFTFYMGTGTLDDFNYSGEPDALGVVSREPFVIDFYESPNQVYGRIVIAGLNGQGDGIFKAFPNTRINHYVHPGFFYQPGLNSFKRMSEAVNYVQQNNTFYDIYTATSGNWR